jgi:hypothetical protein
MATDDAAGSQEKTTAGAGSGPGVPEREFLSAPTSRGSEPRSWIPWLVASAVILVVLGVAIVLGGRRRNSDANLATAAPDPYAAHLPISHVQMSEAANFAGSKLTYVDGQIANTGGKAVTGVTVAVMFRNDLGEPPQQEVMPLRLIRTREPYVDIQPVSADPLKPGETKDFRLIFDHVTSTWNGQYPEIRVVRSEEK